MVWISDLTQDPPSIPTVEELSERDLIRIDFINDSKLF
jgi:hypothetical protein